MSLRPIVLKGHERPVTMMVFNREGDLLFSASKGKNFCVYRTANLERIGTYNGHNGSVNAIDVTRDTKFVVSASSDSTAKLWDAATGEELFNFPHLCAVRCVGLSEGDEAFFTVNDVIMGYKPVIRIFDLAKDLKDQNSGARKEITCQGEHKVLYAKWGPPPDDGDNGTIYTACEDGSVRIYDVVTGEQIKVIPAHSKPVMSIQFNADKSLFVTASRDGTAKLYDSSEWKCLKTYHTGRPINSASISPLKRHVAVAGGQDAASVTTTRVDSSQFHAVFFQMAWEQEIASLPGHFGPVNWTTFSPDGTAFVTGGEDGFVRYNRLGAFYLKDKLDKTFSDHYSSADAGAGDDDE